MMVVSRMNDKNDCDMRMDELSECCVYVCVYECDCVSSAACPTGQSRDKCLPSSR